MTGTSEFWKAVKNHKPQKLAVIEYRAYHKDGKVVSATSGAAEKLPKGGIAITKELYENTSLLYRCRVIDGELVKVKSQDPARLQLEQAEDGPLTSLKNNIIFVAEEGDNYKQKENYVKISSTRKL